MPELPENKLTESISSGSWNSFSPNIPEVHSIHTNALLSAGWERKGSTYAKGENVIKYNGVHWMLNEVKRVEYMEDLK